MRTSDNGLALIKHFEGFAAKPYRCPAGYLTIGYGHIVANQLFSEITREQAETLLRADVRVSEIAVMRLIHRALLPHQFDALVSFTFNLGAGALQRSRLRRLVNATHDEAAAAEFKRWVFAGGRKLPGLMRRRIAESRLYAGSPWQVKEIALETS